MGQLTLNPHASIVPVGETSPAGGYYISVPDRPEGRQERLIESDAGPLFLAVQRLHDNLTQARAKVVAADVPHLVDLGLIVDRASIARRPRFRNPLEAVPQAGDGDARVALELLGTLRFEAGAQAGSSALLDPDGTCVWHADTPSAVGLPWWPDEPMAQALRRVAHDRAAGAVTVLPTAQARALVAAGMARRAGADDGRAAPATARARFERQLYTTARIVPAPVVAAARAYYRSMCAEGFYRLGDGGTRRYWAHNDPLGLLLRAYAAPRVGEIVGRPLELSYTYFSGYRRSAELLPHTDRKQCEYTLNLMLGYEPASGPEVDWPLVLSREGSRVELRQSVGESVLFCGRVIEHGRPPLPEGHECDVLLLHFVNAGFEGPLD